MLLLGGCGPREPAWRTYEEVAVPDPTAQASPVAASGAAVPLKWTAPAGWIEEAGSGMRLAAFSIRRSGGTGVCTMITLRGPAGGLEANVRRWIGQLGLPEPPADELAAFLARQERFRCQGGFDGVRIDLTGFKGQPPGAASMLGAVITLGDSTLFAKFTGPAGLLKEERSSFAALCGSVRASP